jgi:hypothetical protein
MRFSKGLAAFLATVPLKLVAVLPKALGFVLASRAFHGVSLLEIHSR